ncbi:hypothetical protein SUGI_0434420 [Cryptomeria japonica]|uniref:uncharacterized protein LOC131061845 n=1 Tax=Cryptomeria japonica TaxID=3369 RepID=UPI002408C3CE|nr:uncharacterized protein LOC131061845 [Cryptomeria japonica]GLJ23019.1 hypothetical protein SUGI_0434420 [Cryptomeria japonica]
MEAEKNMQEDLGDFDGQPNADDQVNEEVKLKYSSRKIFLQSYPLLWEKEIERLTVIKSMQRRLRIVVAKLVLLKKFKPKIAASAFFVGSCSSRSFNLHMTLFEASNKPEPLKV